MEWLLIHGESIVAIGGALLAFVSWNIAQGQRLKTLEKELGLVHTEQASMRTKQDNIQSGLTEELRRIGEKLAHIEGFLLREKK